MMTSMIISKMMRSLPRNDSRQSGQNGFRSFGTVSAGALFMYRRIYENMKKGDIFEGTIEKVSFPNKGLVRTEEGAVTVKNGIPGQKVRSVINKKRGTRLEGRLLEVLRRLHVPDHGL